MASTKNHSQITALHSSGSKASPNNSHAIWTHTPPLTTIAWLLISLPLVAWDTGYVFLRPHSMLGGAWHAPLWTPYGLYGVIDHVYGLPAWESHSGFTGAQSALNVVETALYMLYLSLVAFDYAAAPSPESTGLHRWLGVGETRGRKAAWAVLVGFAAAVMTLSKTTLYMCNEAFASFGNIAHNSLSVILTMWILPNGMWILFPAYLVFTFGSDILRGLGLAQERAPSKEE
ncbi:MAG: hypothetical protein M1829_000996 [Trizodia sp. TS-e1964]|nr:MAG: hypothetical protein M1829_000996 [Trizodia sp. TS-e1964]